jgi:two-component system, LuxR family, sensor kinase FixL
MSWVTVIWSMVASACLTLAALHLLIWWRRREARAHALFFLAAVGTAFLAVCELWGMRAQTPAEYGLALRWGNLPYSVVIISLVGFIRVYLRAGRPGLAWVVCGVRTLSLVVNFTSTVNIQYQKITALRHVRFLGESLSIPEGVTNVWVLVTQTSMLLFVVFAVDAMLTVWRRGDRRPAMVLLSAIVLFVLVSLGQSVLTFWGIMYIPITLSVYFLGIVAVMSFNLSDDVIRTAGLLDDLRESEDRMALAAEAAGFGVWVWVLSIPSNQIWGSERWRHLFAFAPAAVVNFEMVLQRIHPDNREMVERELRCALAGRGSYAVEFRVILPDGNQRWIASRGHMYPEAQGRPARMLGMAIDITGRKQAEQEIAQQRNELAQVTRVSTISQLASSLAHELNQPLGAILRNAEAAELFLQDPSPDLDEIRAILADIRKDDQRAGEIIDRMRAWMKRREVERRPVSITLLVDDTFTLVRPDAEMRRVWLVVETDPAVPTVLGDRVLLQQVLLNLLLNAMDALNDNPPASRLVTIQVRPTGAMVEVAVSDTGHGISADNLLRVFEPFFSSKPTGLGMGLAISRSIIEAHGGRLWAESNEAGGATFTIALPMAEGGKTK